MPEGFGADLDYADPGRIRSICTIMLLPKMNDFSTSAAQEAPKRVLVVRLGAVGDVVRTLPAVRLLRQTWTSARIAWVVENGPAPLLEGHPDIDQVLILDRKTVSSPRAWIRGQAFSAIKSFLADLRAFRADLSLDFQSSLKSALVARLSRAPRRFGFDRPFDRENSHLLATHRVPLKVSRISRVERAVALALAAGAADGPRLADLALRKEEIESGRRLAQDLLPRGPRIALAPFSSPRQRWKRYPIEHWAEVARGLIDGECGVVILVGPREETDARRLRELAGGGPLVANGLSLRALAALLGEMDLYVGGDTGPMHLAWAMGTPVLVVYGPTDPVINAPLGEGHVLLHPGTVTRRKDADRFPGVTSGLIVSRAFEQLAGLNNPSWEKRKA